MSVPSRIYTIGQYTIDLAKLIAITPISCMGDNYWSFTWYISAGDILSWPVRTRELKYAEETRKNLVTAWETYFQYIDGQEIKTKKALQNILVDNTEEPATIGTIDQLEVTQEFKGETQ